MLTWNSVVQAGPNAPWFSSLILSGAGITGASQHALTEHITNQQLSPLLMPGPSNTCRVVALQLVKLRLSWVKSFLCIKVT